MATTPKLDAHNQRGVRYIAYARCAAEQGSAQSLRRQIHLIRQFANSLQMRCAGEVRLVKNGISPELRPDLKRLLARKRTHDDFDVLIMVDHARLTRTDGGTRIEAIFGLQGVRIVYLTDVGHNIEMAQRCITEPHRGGAYFPAQMVVPPPARRRKRTARTHKTVRP